jgi:hypothetical protein
MMYSVEYRRTKKGQDCFYAYPDPKGIDSFSDLIEWRDSDPSNILVLCDDELEALQMVTQEITTTKSKIL